MSLQIPLSIESPRAARNRTDKKSAKKKFNRARENKF